MYLPRVRAPRLPDDPALWLNTGGRALSLRAGVTYLLDFWTYGCINCVHVLDDLDFLEAKYAGQPFLVIGVHSGKFPNEKHAENVRHALLRHGIRHPVVRDDDFAVWRSYAVRAWPTLVLVDAKGYVVGAVSGEGHRQVLDEAVGAALTAAGLAGVEAPPFPALRPERRPETALAFTGMMPPVAGASARAARGGRTARRRRPAFAPRREWRSRQTGTRCTSPTPGTTPSERWTWFPAW
jgi:thiol-disulfide isomerase/thioredoxin